MSARRLLWRDTLIRRLADWARRLSRATWACTRSRPRYDCAAIHDDGAWRRYTRRAAGLGRIRGVHPTSDDFDGSAVSGALDALVADGTARGGGAIGRRIRDGWLGRFWTASTRRIDGASAALLLPADLVLGMALVWRIRLGWTRWPCSGVALGRARTLVQGVHVMVGISARWDG